MAYDWGTDLGQYDPWLKDFYLTNWIDMLNGSTTTWQMFRQSVVEYKGRRMVIPVRTQRNASPMFMQRSTAVGQGLSTLSDPGQQGVEVVYPRPRLFTASIMLPQDTIDQAKTDRGAFYDAVDFEMMGVLRDCKERLDAQCYDDGTGKLPYYLLHTNVAGTWVPSCLQVNGVNVLLNGSPYWHIGKRVSVYNAGYTIHHTRNAPVTNLNSAEGVDYISVSGKTDHGDGTCTCQFVAGPNLTAGNLNWTAGVGAAVTQFAVEMPIASANFHDYNSLQWVSNADLEGRGFRGLPAMVAPYDPLQAGGAALTDIGYLGVNRAGNAWWQSQIDTSNGSLNDAYTWHNAATGHPAMVMQKMIDDIHDNSLGEIDQIFMSRWATRVMQSLAAGGINPPSSKQQFQNTVKTWVGFTDKDQDKHPGSSDWVMFNEKIPIIVDKYASPYVLGNGLRPVYQPIWFCDSSTQYIGVVTDFSWWDVGGIFQPVPGAAASNYNFGVVANLYMLADFVCDAPNRNGIMTAPGISSETIAI